MLGWFKRRKQNPKRLLKDALGNYQLPSFPVVVAEAMRELRDPNASLGDVAEGLMRDPKVSVRLLNLANSPAYGLRHPARNVHHAASLLGRSEVEALLLSVAVKGMMPKAPRGFDQSRFWQAAARRAATARALAKKLHPSSISESFTASLLQDMAIPLLLEAKPRVYGKMLERWRAGEDELEVLERAELGWDHALIAAAMSTQWGFPELLTSAIGGHHGDEQDVPPAVALVACLRERDPEEDDFDVLVDAAIERFDIEAEELEELVDTAFDEADTVAAALAA